MIYYLLAVGLCWFVFYFCYEVLLARLTFFKVNRYYLITTVLLGLVLPLIPAVNWFSPTNSNSSEQAFLLKPVVITMQAAEQSIEEIVVTPISEHSNWHWEDGLLIIYFIGVLITGLRFVIGIERIMSLHKKGHLERRDGYTLVKTNKNHLPFSFFNYLFWSKNFAVEKPDEERIVHHELAHIKEHHSVDVLLIEIIKMFFWYNPFIYLYKKATTEVHEYLADAAVINTFQKKKQYGLLLLRQTQSGQPLALANHFIHSQLKKRLQMMTRSQTQRSAIWKYALIIPLVGILGYVFAQQQQPVKQALDKTIHVIGYGENGVVPAFNAQRVYADLTSDLAELKNENSEKTQHDAYNLLSARYVKLMNDYPTHQQTIIKLTQQAIDETNAPFAIETSMNYDFAMVIPNWVKQQNGTANVSGEIFKVVEVMPRYPGCEEVQDFEKRNLCSQKKMLTFIYQHIKYPALAREAGIQGTVVINFVVTDKGKIANLKLIREIGGGCGDEALRVISEMPDWMPGKQGGQAVNVSYNIPIKYKLDGEKVNKNDVIKKLDAFTDKDKSAQPLLIIDGKEMPIGDVNSLNADDIEKIEVLKGEAAIKKYGDKGSNGVLVVSTKNNTAKKSKLPGEEELFQVVEEMPRFPGCEAETDDQIRKNCAMKKMFEFIYGNIKYPKEAHAKGIEGTVIVRFIVDKTGAIRDAELTRDIGGGCGDAVIKVVDMMPDWIPGKQKGKHVNVVFNLPIKFKLGKSETSEKNQSDEVESTAIKLEKSLQLDQFNAFPNPAESQLTIRFKGKKAPTVITLMDAAGKEIFREELPQFSGDYNREVNLKTMARGTIFLQVTQGDLKFMEKIVLQ